MAWEVQRLCPRREGLSGRECVLGRNSGQGPLQSCWFGEWAFSRVEGGQELRSGRSVWLGPGHIAPARRLPRRPCLAWDPPLRVLGISRHFCQQSKSKIHIEREPSGGGA